MNILGFRTNKLWKKIIAVSYYLFYSLMILMIISYPHSDEILQYGNKQDIINSNFFNISILLFFALPIIILEIRYRLKLNFKKTFLCSFICFVIWIIFIMNTPGNSDQYNSYLDSKKEIQETEVESQESENPIEEMEIKETVNDVIIVDNINQDNDIDINEEIEEEKKEDYIEEVIEDNKINEESNIEKVEDIKKEEVFESIKNQVNKSSSVVQNENVVENEIIQNEVIEEVIQKQSIENIIETKGEYIQEENIQNIVIPETYDKDLVWICDTGKKYHNNPACSNMNYPYQVTKDEAIASGRDACKKCYGR